MDDSIDLEVYGIEELDAKLKDFNAELVREVFVESIAHGAAFIAELAKQNAPILTESFGKRTPGELRDAINVIMEATNPDKPERIGALITPWYTGGSIDEDPGIWGKFVEYGHDVVLNKKVVGHVPPHPYLRPALDEGGEEAIGVFVETAISLFDAMPGESDSGGEE